jgi:predicted type IV restriction endonuclease
VVLLRLPREKSDMTRVATKSLAAKHLCQVESYAVNEGVEWVILPSGVVWQVYHITGGLPIVVENHWRELYVLKTSFQQSGRN